MIPEPDGGVRGPVGPGQVTVDRVKPDLGVVNLIGEHDLHTADDVRSRIRTLLGDGSRVTVDLSRATFVDSSILAVLVEAHERARENGAGFSICLPGHEDGAVRRVLDVTGLTSTLNAQPGLDAAVAAARRGHE